MSSVLNLHSGLVPFLFGSCLVPPTTLKQNAALSLVPKIKLLARSSSWEISLKTRRGFPQEEGSHLDGHFSHCPTPFLWSHPFCFKLESSRFLSGYGAHSTSPISQPFPQTSLPSSYPGPSKGQGSLSLKEEALFSSWYKDLQFPLVSCWRQHVCWAASFSKSSLASCTVFSCQDNPHRVDGELPKEQDFLIAFSPELPTMILKSSITDSCRRRLI